MSSTNIYAGIILGAVAGSAIAMLDKTTRQKVAARTQGAKGAIQRYKEHPSEAAKDVRVAYERIEKEVTEKTDAVLKIVSEIQDTVEMIDLITGRGSKKSNEKESSSKMSE